MLFFDVLKHESLAAHDAYVRRDLEGLKNLLGWPPGAGEIILEYVIYGSPRELILALPKLSADPGY